MSQERWSFWKKRQQQQDVGEDERRRSRSESAPAGPPPAAAPRGPEVPGDEVQADAHQSVDEPDTAVPRAVDEPVAPADPQAATPISDDASEVKAKAEAPAGQLKGASTKPVDPFDFGEDEPPPPRPNLAARRRGTLSKPSERPKMPLSPQQKLLLLDTWQRSGLPARDFGALVNVSRHTLYAWKRRFEQQGPAGLMEQPRGAKSGSRLPELTKRTILMLKQAHPDWGCQRISDMLLRGPALPASPSAVARVLHEAGYEMEEVPTRSHAAPVRSFERAGPNQLWQTDLFTFMLKRQNRRVYLVAFMDDHSRFITGYGLHASQSAALVIEVVRAALAAYGVPAEMLTDNGTQYVTWRGKSQFNREMEKRGIKHLVARPRRPQTLGKIERFWGSLWRECVESSVFLDLADARQRIGLYIDYYNLQRPHQGIGGLVPADRFFHAAPEVLKTLKERVASNALELARQGVPKKPFYLTGQLDGKPFSVHREGDRVILHQVDQPREEIDLVAPQADETSSPTEGESMEPLPTPLCPDGSPTTPWQIPSHPSPPGTSAIDELRSGEDATAGSSTDSQAADAGNEDPKPSSPPADGEVSDDNER